MLEDMWINRIIDSMDLIPQSLFTSNQLMHRMLRFGVAQQMKDLLARTFLRMITGLL